MMDYLQNPCRRIELANTDSVSAWFNDRYQPLSISYQYHCYSLFK